MMGPGHRAFTACATLGLATSGLVDPGTTLVLAASAMLTTAGRVSPDGIEDWPIVGRLMGAHRTVSHGWGWPVLVAVAMYVWGVPLILYGPVLGWALHLPADALFGKRGYGTGRGIPVSPLGTGARRWGTGWKVTGPYSGHSLGELAATCAFAAGAAVQVVLLAF